MVEALPGTFRKDLSEALRLLLNKLTEVNPSGFFALPRFHRSTGSSTKVSTISETTAEELACGLDPRELCE